MWRTRTLIIQCYSRCHQGSILVGRMTRDVSEFTQSCIHCIIFRNSERIARPLAEAIHGEKPNEVVHADLLYMGPPEGSNIKYFLSIKDNLSSYTWLYLCDSADGDAGTSVLGKLMACFGSMRWLVTDQSSHFIASLMTSLTKDARLSHHFIAPYCLCTNRTVERLCKEVLRISKTLLSEWKLPVIQCPSTVEAVQRVINQWPLKRLGKTSEGRTRCSMKIFTGLRQAPLLICPTSLRKCRDTKAIHEARLNEIANVSSLYDAIERIHKEVSENNSANRARA